MGFYTRLKFSEREELSRCFAEGRSLREAARRIRRHPSTLSRELHRTGYSKLTYRASKLILGPRERYNNPPPPRRFLKIENKPELQWWIRFGLRQYWSPEQIALYLKKAYPGNQAMQISHETIYQYLCVLGRGELNRAEAAELMELPGIGPVTAERILEDRKMHGRFLTLSDLKRVKGITPKVLERMKGLVRFD